MLGDILAIREKATQLSSQDATLEPFANVITQMAKNFDENAIINLLESQL